MKPTQRPSSRSIAGILLLAAFALAAIAFVSGCASVDGRHASLEQPWTYPPGADPSVHPVPKTATTNERIRAVERANAERRAAEQGLAEAKETRQTTVNHQQRKALDTANRETKYARAKHDAALKKLAAAKQKNDSADIQKWEREANAWKQRSMTAEAEKRSRISKAKKVSEKAEAGKLSEKAVERTPSKRPRNSPKGWSNQQPRSRTAQTTARGAFLPPSNPRAEAPSGSLPSIEEELWVIARATPANSEPDPDSSPSGALFCPELGGQKNIPLPLKHTAVDARIDGHIATVKVTQQFHNLFSEKIEAKYVFPLPQNAAINEFVMTIGERHIRGIIREKQEAEQIYKNAKAQGRVASLLTQQRPNVFTQSVANIEPGKQIDVNITYFNTLAIKDGWYEFVFPMVVGPRFNPPGDSDGVSAVARTRKGASGQKTEVTHLSPKERSGHDISLSLTINAGAPIGSIESVNHKIERDKIWESLRKIKLARNDRLPNKDFVLRYRLNTAEITPSFTAYNSPKDEYFTLTLHPPANTDRHPGQPLEMIFVLDCSGSMNGAPLFQAKAAITHALRQLNPDDTFQIIRFSQNASQLGSAPLKATRENVRMGLKHVAGLSGGGGTMMIEGVKTALDFPHEPNRLRFVCFMTDRFIGNEAEILGAIRNKIKDSRIFSFGVGSSPNRYLMERMAKLGRGAVAYLSLTDDGGKVMDRFLSRVRQPALTDIQIDWDKLGAIEVFPREIPDLFAGRPISIVGKFTGEGRGEIKITGNQGAGNPRTIELPYCAGSPESLPPALPAIWARMKIADLMDQSTFDQDPNLESRIKKTALEHNLMSAYTAFIAVDASRKATGKAAREISQAVPTPEGVRFEETVAQ